MKQSLAIANDKNINPAPSGSSPFSESLIANNS
jgi:hypothetical protein